MIAPEEIPFKPVFVLSAEEDGPGIPKGGSVELDCPPDARPELAENVPSGFGNGIDDGEVVY